MGSSWNNTLNAGGNYSTLRSGNNLIVYTENGTTTIQNNSVVIQGTLVDSLISSDWATIKSSGGSTVVAASVKAANGTSGNDTITTATISDSVNSRTINGNAGNDYIQIGDSTNYYAIRDNSKVTVNGGAGNDTISISRRRRCRLY